MPSTKRLKNNDTIEIRLPDEAKAAFMRRCQQDGRTASEAVRTFIDGQLTSRSPRGQRLVSSMRIGFVGLAGTVLGMGMAAPSIASSAESAGSAFDRLDRDRSGTLTLKEFRDR